MPDVQTNLRILKPSRKAPKPGDLFVMQVPDESFLFGRVIRADALWTLAEGAGPAVLVYIYRARSSDRRPPEREELRPTNS